MPMKCSGPTGCCAANVYVRDRAEGTKSLASATADGKTAPGFATNPAFSPDGSKLAFASTADLTGNPTDAQRLSNGNTFIACDVELMEVDRNGGVVFSHRFPGDSVIAFALP